MKLNGLIFDLCYFIMVCMWGFRRLLVINVYVFGLNVSKIVL